MPRLWLSCFSVFAFLSLINSEEDEDEEELQEEPDTGPMRQVLTPERMRGMHEKMDENSDGNVSLAEIMTYADEVKKHMAAKEVVSILKDMDSNNDGKLSLDEVLKATPPKDEDDDEEVVAQRDWEEEKFKVADQNADGLLDSDEASAMFYPETHEPSLGLWANSTLQSKDANGDGKLSFEEFIEGDEDIEIAEGKGAESDHEEQEEFKKLDRNGDGKLCLEELKFWESGKFHTEEAVKKLFDVADTNGDNQVSSYELDAARAEIETSDAIHHLLDWNDHHDEL